MSICDWQEYKGLLCLLPSSAIAISSDFLGGKNKLTITGVIECVMFIDAPAPHANHVLIALHQKFEPIFVALWSDTIHCEPELQWD